MGSEECVFCQIASGKVDSMTVYEDDKVRAILDINPANPGHILLMPKSHHVVWQLLPDDLVNRLSIVSRNISKVMLSVLDTRGINIYMANGEDAGQRAPHFIMHIIPRYKDDGISFLWQPKKMDEERITTLALKLEKSISESLSPEPPKEPEVKKMEKSQASDEELKILRKIPS